MMVRCHCRLMDQSLSWYCAAGVHSFHTVLTPIILRVSDTHKLSPITIVKKINLSYIFFNTCKNVLYFEPSITWLEREWERQKQTCLLYKEYKATSYTQQTVSKPEQHHIYSTNFYFCYSIETVINDDNTPLLKYY